MSQGKAEAQASRQRAHVCQSQMVARAWYLRGITSNSLGWALRCQRRAGVMGREGEQQPGPEGLGQCTTESELHAEGRRLLPRALGTEAPQPAWNCGKCHSSYRVKDELKGTRMECGRAVSASRIIRQETETGTVEAETEVDSCGTLMRSQVGSTLHRAIMRSRGLLPSKLSIQAND